MSAKHFPAAEWQQTLMAWYEANKRSLPWRNTFNPYHIWVSEVILQQTRVAQGLDYYNRFIAAFPTPEALAQADEQEVLRLWQGLGYYSRARNMHSAARKICEAGEFPRTYEGVRSLRGVGDYTAAAICSIAYGLPVAVVDGNVYRVLSRYFADDTPIDTTLGKKHFTELAQTLLPNASPGTYNQALMDFGAMQCVPKSPHCESCPLANGCLALARKSAESFPVKSRKTKVEMRHMVYLIVRDAADGTWIHQRPAGGIWQGLYEFPLLEFSHTPSLTEVKGHPFCQRNIPAQAVFRNVVTAYTHQLTHRTLKVDCYEVTLPEGTAVPEAYEHVEWQSLDHYPLPQLIVRLVEFADKAQG